MVHGDRVKSAVNTVIHTRIGVLPWKSRKAVVFQAVMITSAVLLPAMCHFWSAPVRWLLPMHWPVILAGLVFGWRGGLAVGFMAAGTNWLLTGFPLLPVLPAMTVELSIYGIVCGLIRERLNWSAFAAVGVGLIAGRMSFILTVLLTGGFEGEFGAYVISAMAPGLTAGIAQVISLPMIARLFIDK